MHSGTRSWCVPKRVHVMMRPRMCLSYVSQRVHDTCKNAFTMRFRNHKTFHDAFMKVAFMNRLTVRYKTLSWRVSEVLRIIFWNAFTCILKSSHDVFKMCFRIGSWIVPELVSDAFMKAFTSLSKKSSHVRWRMLPWCVHDGFQNMYAHDSLKNWFKMRSRRLSHRLIEVAFTVCSSRMLACMKNFWWNLLYRHLLFQSNHVLDT